MQYHSFYFSKKIVCLVFFSFGWYPPFQYQQLGFEDTNVPSYPWSSLYLVYDPEPHSSPLRSQPHSQRCCRTSDSSSPLPSHGPHSVGFTHMPVSQPIPREMPGAAPGCFTPWHESCLHGLSCLPQWSAYRSQTAPGLCCTLIQHSAFLCFGK